MSVHDYDLLVIGAGSGGVRAARTAAGLGARTAVVEAGPLGGTCVNIGCIPKKLLVYAAEFSHTWEEAAGYGWTLPEAPRFDWPQLIQNKNREITRLNGVYQRLLEGAGVTVIAGTARLTGPNEVRVGERHYSAAHILIATGGMAELPEIPGRELAITSDEAFYLPQLPDSVAVVGGGYIAVEFAGIFNGLGARTHLIHRSGQLLRNFDHDLGAALCEEMAHDGIELHLHQQIERIDAGVAGRKRLLLQDGEVIEVDQVLFATGRRPNSAGLGLEELGVECTANGAIQVDAHYRTRVPSILAIGDVLGGWQLTPVALAEAMAVARTIVLNQPSRADYDAIPTAIFSQPQIATVGLSEQEARRRGPIRLFRSRFTPLRHTLSGRKSRTLVKLVVDAQSDRVLGAHMVGEGAAEILQGFAVAVKAGLTKRQFDATLGIHPSAAEEFVTLRQEVEA